MAPPLGGSGPSKHRAAGIDGVNHVLLPLLMQLLSCQQTSRQRRECVVGGGVACHPRRAWEDRGWLAVAAAVGGYHIAPCALRLLLLPLRFCALPLEHAGDAACSPCLCGAAGAVAGAAAEAALFNPLSKGVQPHINAWPAFLQGGAAGRQHKLAAVPARTRGRCGGGHKGCSRAACSPWHSQHPS